MYYYVYCLQTHSSGHDSRTYRYAQTCIQTYLLSAGPFQALALSADALAAAVTDGSGGVVGPTPVLADAAGRVRLGALAEGAEPLLVAAAHAALQVPHLTALLRRRHIALSRRERFQSLDGGPKSGEGESRLNCLIVAVARRNAPRLSTIQCQIW